MKLTVSRETFLAKLGIAARGASTRSAIQTLAGVLIRVDESGAELEATDMELGVRVAVEAAGSTPGQAVVPGRLLLDVVRSLPAEEVSIEYRSAQQDVEVVSGPARFHLRTLPPEDFPKLPQVPEEGVMRVPSGAFVDTIARVARAASRDETRPHLTAVLVHGQRPGAADGGPDSYACRSRRPSWRRAGGVARGNVPARTLQELGRVAGAGESDTIGVAALENQVVFTVDDVMLSSRLVEGAFRTTSSCCPSPTSTSCG